MMQRKFTENNNTVRNIIVVILLFLTFWFGIRPILTGDELERRMAKAGGPSGNNQYALVVFGAEPEGIAAALSGARMGLKTLLVTEDADPGSYIKSGLITYTTPDYATLDGEKKMLNTGFFAEIFGDTGGNFSIEAYIETVKKLMEKEPNLTVLYDAGILSVQTENNCVEEVAIYHDGKKRLIESQFFIDATEDGKVLSLSGVPYYTGSGDINVPNAYMPVVCNFLISNVKWEDIESIRKQDQHMEDFQSVLKQYERRSPKTKISNLSFIGQPDNDIIISGIRMRQVDVDNPESLRKDFEDALAEAKSLTSYLQSVFVPFENCVFRTGPSGFYIPEYRHFDGRYRLSVEDILENTDFPSKIVMASAPIDAEKFVSTELSEEYTYILGNPKVYSIPLECFIAKDLDNLLMVGKKASFSSLASTSAGRMPVSISAGQALGIAAAFCYLNDLTPVELSKADPEKIKDFQNLLRRNGVTLVDFDESNPNANHWAWPSVKVLAGYGLLAGGLNNDYLLDVEAYQENLAILIINLLVKAAPERYTLELDRQIRSFAGKDVLTGEKACEILLVAKNIRYEKGQAFETALMNGLIPENALDKMSPDKTVTLDCVYALTVNLINAGAGQ